MKLVHIRALSELTMNAARLSILPMCDAAAEPLAERQGISPPTCLWPSGASSTGLSNGLRAAYAFSDFVYSLA
eukprot:123937-Amphidinium_carterae.1